MKILSIDIGIKHLAFCLFDIKSKTDYCITKWDIINLCNEEKKICEGIGEKFCKRSPQDLLKITSTTAKFMHAITN